MRVRGPAIVPGTGWQRSATAISATSQRQGNEAAYAKILTLFIIPENSEDFRRSLDRDNRLEEEMGSRP